MTSTPDPRATPSPADMPRREVLRAVGGVGLVAGAAVVAGCGSDETPSTTPAATTPPDEATTSAPDTGEPGAAPLAATSEVPVGGGVINTDERVVVTQPVEGEFRGFSAVCTHSGCVVSSVADGEIGCACHGSRFSADDGSVLAGPAAAPLPEVAVAVEGDTVSRA